MDNRNLQYMKVHDSRTQLAERLERTQAAYNELGAHFETLSTAYSKLVDAVSDKLQRPSITAPSSASSTDLVATMDTKDHLRLLKRADYNEVEYWTEEEYLKETLQGGKRLTDDENVMYWFVQRQDGSIVEGSFGSATLERREFARSQLLCQRDVLPVSGAVSLSYTNSNTKAEPEVLDNAAAAVIAGDSKRPAADSPNEEPAPKKLKQMSKSKVKSKPRSGAPTGAPLPSVSALAPLPKSLSHGTDLPPIPASFSSDVAAKPSTPDTVPSVSSSSSAVSAALPPATAVPSTVTPSLPALPAAAPPTTAATPSPVTISTPAIPDLVSSIPSAVQPTVAATQVPPATGLTVNSPLAYLGEPAGPTTRAEFIEKTANKDAKKDAKAKEHTNSSKSSEGGTESKPVTKMTWLRTTTSTTTRNICLKHYIKKVGKVMKAVFDKYYSDLSEEARKNIVKAGTGDTGTGDGGRRKIRCRETIK
ncbi:hypothetical protein B0H16DRAFT_1716831 [Mycena metata]|uniref:Uncharacterized protein n=1 Tax=Mycena metata TaxID=1033252 RepID=A0AAD7JQ89_9AGAR|nr:hypothetical protein B0H16DRAFT_1716831 [Mycena metata]